MVSDRSAATVCSDESQRTAATSDFIRRSTVLTSLVWDIVNRSLPIMFSPWPLPAQSGGAAVVRPSYDCGWDERSRNPAGPGAGVSAQTGGLPCRTTVGQSPCTTGNPVADAWFERHVTDPELIQGFSELPVFKRKSIVLKCMDKPPDNPNSWINACIKNHRMQDLEKRLTGNASVHSGSYPPANNASGSCGNAGYVWPPGGHLGPYGAHGGMPVPIAPVLSRPASIVGDTGSQAPSWAQRLYTHWPLKKSQLLGEFFSLLSPNVAARVQSLPPATQASMAFGFIVSAPADSSGGDEIVSSWLDRIAFLEQKTGSGMSLTAGLVPSAFILHLQVIVSGGSVAPAVLSMYLLPKIMSQLRADVVIAMLPTIYLPDDEQGGLNAASLSEKLNNVPVNQDVLTYPALFQFLENNTKSFLDTDTKTLFVNTLSSGALPQCPVSSQSKMALHAKSARWIWTVAKASAILRNGLGDANVAELTFGPMHSSADVKHELGAVFGSMLDAQHMISEYSKVANLPLVFSVPSGCTVAQCCKNNSCGELTLDGWKIGAEPENKWEGVKPGVASVLSSALSTQLFQERALTDTETAILHALRISHSSTGEVRYCSRDWFYRWWGFMNTPLPQHLEETKPCARMIITVTGLPAPPCATCATPCGRERFCRSCEEVHELLDRGYHLFTVVDAMAAVLNRALMTWKDGSVTKDWERNAVVERTHACGPECALNPFSGQ